MLARISDCCYREARAYIIVNPANRTLGLPEQCSVLFLFCISFLFHNITVKLVAFTTITP
jgi:hypothetical protein